VLRTNTDSADKLSLPIRQVSMENGVNKLVSVRKQYGVNLFDDVVAKVGGVFVLFYIAASIVGYYFSQWLFLHAIAEDMFLEKGGINQDMSDDEAASFGNKDVS
jgi:hypothetical protein